MLQKNLIFDGTSELNSVLKLEMMSYSDNAYDISIKNTRVQLVLTRVYSIWKDTKHNINNSQPGLTLQKRT